MISAVLDTNVLVSGLWNPEGPAAIILKCAIARKFRWYVSESLFEEYSEVLPRGNLGLDPRQVTALLHNLRSLTVFVTPRRRLHVTSDPDDNKVLECALQARADYVVSGNIRHFPPQYQDIRIIPPHKFITVLAAEPF